VITPNLASRPFLNTRPVWVVTVAAGVLAVALVVLNVVSYLSSNRTLAEQISERDALLAEKNALETEVRAQVLELEEVPWRSLAARVRATNVILHERGFSWLQMLDDVERVLPYEVRVIRISPKVDADGVALSLDVVCRTRDALLELLDKLIADPAFSDVVPLREGTQEGGSSVLGYELSLKVTYHPPEVEA